MADKKTVAVYLEDIDIEIVQEEASLDGSNFSAALRKIVRDWSRIRKSEIATVADK